MLKCALGGLRTDWSLAGIYKHLSGLKRDPRSSSIMEADGLRETVSTDRSPVPKPPPRLDPSIALRGTTHVDAALFG